MLKLLPADEIEGILQLQRQNRSEFSARHQALLWLQSLSLGDSGGPGGATSPSTPGRSHITSPTEASDCHGPDFPKFVLPGLTAAQTDAVSQAPLQSGVALRLNTEKGLGYFRA